MKKSLIILGTLAITLANAQDRSEYRGRVGINTDVPKASLHIGRHTGIPAENAQGVLFPTMKQNERNAMKREQLVSGLQIFNEDKNCIDWWTGKNWQCTDGFLRDNHGDSAQFRATEQWYSPTDISIYKSNCPVGQQAKPEAKILISYTQPNPNPPIVGEGTAVGPTLGDAKDKALEIAKADFYRKAQDYVNAQFGTASCEALPVKDPDRGVVINTDDNTRVELEDRAYWFSSIEDDDYLPLKQYQGPATLEKIPADGVASGEEEKEPAIKVLAKIPTLENAIQVFIPIKLTKGSNLSLSEHIMHIDIPAKYTADDRTGVVTFTWNPVEVTSATRFIPAKFYAKEEIILKGLDLIGGLGEDQKGMVIGVFRYPKNSDEKTQDSWTGKYELRLISGILDKNFMYKSQLKDVEDYRHRFIYVPVQGPGGKMWLNNNLGANYSNLNMKAVFNPNQQAKRENDHHAYGSLGQWGRRFNGRELMTWTSSGSGTPTFKDEPGYNWYSDESAILKWEEDNCPEGWHTPSEAEFRKLITDNGGTITYPVGGRSSISYPSSVYLHGLRVPFAGYRSGSSGSSLGNTGSGSWLWSRSESGARAHRFYGSSSSANVSYSNRSYGYALRCLRN